MTDEASETLSPVLSDAHLFISQLGMAGDVESWREAGCAVVDEKVNKATFRSMNRDDSDLSMGCLRMGDGCKAGLASVVCGVMVVGFIL